MKYKKLRDRVIKRPFVLIWERKCFCNNERGNLMSAKAQNNTERAYIEKIVDNMTLFDDMLMSMAFDDNIPATELMLKIILGRDDIEVISVTSQKELQSPVVSGHTIQLDILIRDSSKKMYNVEVQRKNSGASPRRARYHSSMQDSRMLTEGEDFKCKNSKDAHYSEFASCLRYFKDEEGGREIMCETVERYAKEKEIAILIETGVEFSIPKELIIEKLCKRFLLSQLEAEEQYESYVAGAEGFI